MLVGPSGAGKSTVMEILLGFVRPDGGRVTFNGADIAALVPQALSRLTAWIGQQPLLFAGSIRDNILFRPARGARRGGRGSRPPGPRGQLRRRAAAGAGYAGGRGRLRPVRRPGAAGGDRPRLPEERARCCCSTSRPLHLDPATEAEVLDSLRRLTVGRTVILASHSSAAHGFGGRRLDLRAGRAAA